MGIYQEKYSREYFTGVDRQGQPVGYGATLETNDEGLLTLRAHDRIILDRIDFSKKKVLDIGFGRGEALCYAFLQGAKSCTGVDFASAAVEIARDLIAKRQLPEAGLFQSDALSFTRQWAEKYGDDPEKKFDIVILLDVVEHIPRSELREVMACIKKILTDGAILAINTPAYKYDNDVIQNGYDDRNMQDCYDTSDLVPETRGMHCNKYTVVSLQQFMAECGFIHLSEAHFFVDQNLFRQDEIEAARLAYAERWERAIKHHAPLKSPYQDDVIEFPYITVEPLLITEFKQGNMGGLKIFLTENYRTHVFAGDYYDREMFDSLKADEIENKVVFDVGGYMGVSSLLFAKQAGSSGKVITFEPNPWNQNRIFKNLSHNQNLAPHVLVYPFALGDCNDSAGMTLSSDIDSGYSSTSRLNIAHPKIASSSLPQAFFEIDVDIRTLDWFVETYGVIPDLIKVDIEGAEHSLLRGGIQTLQNYKPVLYIELHSEFCALQCSLLLSNLGYTISVLKEEPDNRLMIKAVSHSDSLPGQQLDNDKKFLEVISFQNEISVNLQRLLNKEEKLHQALHASQQALQATYQELQSNHQALQSRLQSVQTDYQSLQSEHQSLQSEYQSLQAAHQALQSERQSLQSAHQSLQSQHLSLQAQHQALFAEQQSTQSTLQSLQTQYHSLHSEYQSLQASHQALIENHQAMQSTFERVLAEYQDLLKSRVVRYTTSIKEFLRKFRKK